MSLLAQRPPILLACALWFVLPGAALPIPAQDPPVRVYTNADLEKFAVPTPPPNRAEPDGSVAESSDERAEDWRFVADFIERERESIRLRRLDDLERQAVEIERRKTEESYARRESASYRYVPIYRPWPGLFSRKPARIGGFRDRPGGGKPEDKQDASTTDPSRHDRIVPLHARRP